jgi:O-antigen ligase
MVYLFFICLLPSLGEIGTPTIWQYLWPLACTVIFFDWCRRILFSPTNVVIHPYFSVSYLLLLVTWMLSLSDSMPTIMLAPEVGDYIKISIIDTFLTSTILMVSISASANRLQIERIFKVIIFTSIPYAITIFFLGGEIEKATGEIARRSGIFVDFSPAGLYMLFASILAFAFVQMKKKAVLFIGCILLFLSTLVQSLSKTHMVILLILVVLSPLLEGNWRRSAAMILVTSVMLFASLPLLPTAVINALHQTFVSIFIDPSAAVAGQGGSFGFRVKHFWMGIELFQEYPIFGFGLKKHLIVTPMVFHMTYATILSETGIVGFSAFILFIVVVLCSGFRTLKTLALRDDRNTYLLMKSLILSFVLVLLSWSTQPWGGQEDRLFWVIAGLIGGMEIWVRKSNFPAVSKGAMKIHNNNEKEMI